MDGCKDAMKQDSHRAPGWKARWMDEKCAYHRNPRWKVSMDGCKDAMRGDSHWAPGWKSKAGWMRKGNLHGF